MNKRILNIAIAAAFLVTGVSATAQVVQQKVGDNPMTINPNAVLDVESTNKGLLLPRLALESTNSFAPLTAHEEGMTVYNTATAGTDDTAVTPGYYYNDGTKWVRIATGSDAKDEPWFIQGTSDEATTNTDNIYQQGKVAVGFESTDAVSGKQLEVKGDFKTEAEVAGRFVGLETNMQGSGISMWYNANDELMNGPDDMGMIQVHPNSVHLIAQSATNLGTTQIAPGVVEYRVGQWGLTDGVSINRMDNNQIFLSNSSGTVNDGDLTRLTVQKGHGINFQYLDTNADLVGSYTFPRTAGQVGQVLGVETNISDNSTLAWKDINDLVDVSEPWKIQNTTNDATANTDNIYQQGKVAVGFESTDAVSGKQLEVKGDIKSKHIDTNDNYVYGLETNVDNGSGMKDNVMYVANNENLGTATHSSFLDLNKDNVALMSIDKRGAIQKFNTLLVGNQTNGGIVAMASETSEGKYASVGASTWADDVEATLQTRQTVAGNEIEMDLMVRPKSGISFTHQGVTEYGSYTFPTNSPEEGQVLVGSAISEQLPIGRQLEWKNINDLVKAAMPKFFYMPSVVIPTHNTSTGALLTGTQTINLYESYTQQFGYTGGTNQVRSNNTSTIPTLAANELDYFITYFDEDVFENVAVSAAGVLTYSIKSGAVVTPKTFMNIVFKVQD